MAIETMQDLFMHGLRDIYFAEKKIAEWLPKMARTVESSGLRDALESHLEETKGQIERLEQVFKNCGEEAKGEKCPAIEGLVKEGDELVSEIEDREVVDAAILAGAQAVEHYEIARYGTLCEWAELLGHDDSVPLLEETLQEEKSADEKLNRLAKDKVNQRAAA